MKIIIITEISKTEYITTIISIIIQICIYSHRPIPIHIPTNINIYNGELLNKCYIYN
jgi:hypothetical protein